MISHLVFDFGGVLVPLYRERAVAAFQNLGIRDADSYIDSFHHSGLFLGIEDGSILADEFVDALSALAGKPLDFAAVQQAWLQILDPPCPETLNLLDFLHLTGKYTLSILSNNNPFVMAWAKSSSLSVQGRPITDYVDRLYISYELKCVKPDSLFFERFLSLSGAKAQHCLFIDDSPANITSARALGFQTLLARNSNDWRKELQQRLKA